MRESLLGLMVASLLMGCEDVSFLGGKAEEQSVVPDTAGLGAIRPVARSDAIAQRQAAISGNLGETVATLDETLPGLTLKTPLVTMRQAGFIQFGAKRLNVTLIPLESAEASGSLISLEAMEAIGAPVTGFPQLTVFGI